MKTKSLFTLITLLITTILNASPYSYLSFLHLDNKITPTISEQVREKSILLEKYYVGMPKAELVELNGLLSKVYNPCDLEVCGLSELKNKYYKKQQRVIFNEKRYSVFFSFEDDKLEKLHLVRKIERKEYSLQKNQKETVFDYFSNKTNLLKEKENTQFFLEYCYDGKQYLGDKGFNNIYEMYGGCDQLFRKSVDSANFTMKRNYQETFYIEGKEGMDLQSLNETVEKREMEYPFKRTFNTGITCSVFNYCVETITISNKYSEFLNNNFMIYENDLLLKDLGLLDTLVEERKKIHCNRDHKEEGIPKKVLEDRLLCDLRFDIFETNMLYVLKVNKFNEEHIDFSNTLKYKNIYGLINEKMDLLKNEKILYTDYQKRELEIEIKEYQYLLSLVKIHEPIKRYDVFPQMSNEEIYNKEVDLMVLKRQIEHSKEEIERYKREKVQYKLDLEYTRKTILDRILGLKS